MTAFNYVSCLKPLLRSLGWQGATRRIFEAAPFDVTHIDLVDLKNIFVSLGYTCYSKTNRLSHVSRSFLPTLFINESKDVYWVIYERTEKDFLYIDCRTGQKSAIPITKRLKGTRYNFVKDLSLEVPVSSWSSQLFRRFKHELWQPLGIATLISFWSALVPLFFYFVYDHILLSQSQKTLTYFSGGLIAVLLSLLWFSRLKNRCLAYLGARLNVIINTELLKHLLMASPAKVNDFTLSEQLAKLKHYDQVRDGIWTSVVAGILDLPLMTFSTLLLWAVGGQLIVVPVAAIGLHFILIRVFYGKLKELHAKVTAVNKICAHFFTETLLNVQSIKNIAAEITWNERYRTYLAESLIQERELNNTVARLSNWSLWISKGAAVATVFWAAYLMKDGTLTQAALISVVLFLWQIFSTLYTLVGIVPSIPKLQETLNHIEHMISLTAESIPAIQPPSKFQGHLVVDNLYFRYSGEAQMALQGVKMEAKPGEIVAVIGQNASGKSTFVHLLMRLYEPMSGDVKIDGINIHRLDPIPYRQSIGYAPSTPQFFRGTIAQNMRLAQPEATDQEIVHVLDQVGLTEDLQKLAKGIYTPLSEEPEREFSAGFLQKLNLARALIRDSNILIFDEPTGHIDFKSEAIFKNTIENLKGKKTVIIVTHRPSIINLADRILVLNKGIMRLFGPRDQVLNILSGNAA